ncbi:PstS ABC-type phosphate transport system, periplasmic component [uncultured Caudovirales phage]|uniref:PstS ABC-type phosphate transport system, periplasmic component n=1 Tax=uncultured Caudovirales phage TaxID=2100421 RepID=A0A6J7WSI2_9CAUD|nr:PstS ABC-type phosphate transport system, periplasmic component [uncultured Caudovirales phage]
MLKKLAIIAASVLTLATTSMAAEVTGAGASFPYPIYSKWADSYKKSTGNVVNYQSIGSGAGIKQIDAKTVTFGATDVPVKPEDLEKKGQVQFPMIVGGIVAIYNIKGVDNLTLTTDILAKIYMQKINKWNDKEIAALNPNVKLPDLGIIKIRRSDGSGTTWNLTKFFSEANAEWKANYGIGQAIEWQGTTIGSKGNEGVSSGVSLSDGAIGYVEYAYAKQNDLKVVSMIGTDGKKVAPSLKAFQTTWPMVATSYIVMYKTPVDAAVSKEAIKFFEYTHAHDKDAEELDYVPLTAAQKADVKKIWSEIK